MKKLAKLGESKLEKFASNEIQNSHMVFGGQKYSTVIVGGGPIGASDFLDTNCYNGWEVSWDGGGTWAPCDFSYAHLAAPPLPGPGTVYNEERGIKHDCR